MTGPEHYREAEILLGFVADTSTNYDDTNPAAALLFAQAQVHATLALAAATIAAPYISEGDTTAEWLRVTSGADTEGEVSRG